MCSCWHWRQCGTTSLLLRSRGQALQQQARSIAPHVHQVLHEGLLAAKDTHQQRPPGLPQAALAKAHAAIRAHLLAPHTSRMVTTPLPCHWPHQTCGMSAATHMNRAKTSTALRGRAGV